MNTKWLKEFKNSKDLDNREFYISFLVELREVGRKYNFNLEILNKIIKEYEL